MPNAGYRYSGAYANDAKSRISRAGDGIENMGGEDTFHSGRGARETPRLHPRPRSPRVAEAAERLCRDIPTGDRGNEAKGFRIPAPTPSLRTRQSDRCHCRKLPRQLPSCPRERSLQPSAPTSNLRRKRSERRATFEMRRSVDCAIFERADQEHRSTVMLVDAAHTSASTCPKSPARASSHPISHALRGHAGQLGPRTENRLGSFSCSFSFS